MKLKFPFGTIMICAFAFLFSERLTGQVGINTTTPDTNAVLDVVSTTKGVLIPRVALSATNLAAPMSSHVAGMIIYNTATAGTSPNNVIPGFYYNDSIKWVRIASADGLDTTNDAWINDNTNTQVTLGTQSNGSTARTAGTEFVIKDNGNVGIGTASPSAKLEVNGNVEIQNVDGIGNDNPYKPLVWNTTTKRLETTPSNGTYINKTTASIAVAGNSGTIYTFDSGAAYEVKVYYETPCSGMFYNKFFVVAANINSNSAINYVGGVSQNGAPVATITDKTTISIANPYTSGCGTGDSTSNFNYTITVGANTGDLSITNNGTTAKSYRIIIEKIFD